MLTGPRINGVAVNREVHSAWAEGHNLHVIFTDMTELVVSWGDTGPELKGRKLLQGLPAVPITDGAVSRLLVGKKVAVAHTNDDGDLLIRCECGHEAVVAYENGGPVIRSMNVRLVLPTAGCEGIFGGFA